MGSIEWCARTCQSFFSLAESSTDGRGVESEPNSASTTPMDVDTVRRGKGKGCCRRPDHAAKDCKLNQGEGKDQTKGKAKSTTDKNSPATFERASAAVLARNATSGQTAGSVWQKRKTRKSTPLMEPRRLRRWRQWKTQERLMRSASVCPMMLTAVLTLPKHGF